MSNSYFKFRTFTVHQDRCAMKVGTDGTLLGAWACGGMDILDIGTGTGLVAMMMAQRFPDARVVGVELDGDACQQAHENFVGSPYADRLQVVCAPIQEYCPQGLFDAIVCNPPFFSNSLKSPDNRRTMARHADTLTFQSLFRAVGRLLAAQGVFTVVIPADARSAFEMEAVMAGLFLCRECLVRTKASKPPRRCLLAFSRQPATVEKSELVIGSDAYQLMMKDFYIL